MKRSFFNWHIYISLPCCNYTYKFQKQLQERRQPCLIQYVRFIDTAHDETAVSCIKYCFHDMEKFHVQLVRVRMLKLYTNVYKVINVNSLNARICSFYHVIVMKVHLDLIDRKISAALFRYISGILHFILLLTFLKMFNLILLARWQLEKNLARICIRTKKSRISYNNRLNQQHTFVFCCKQVLLKF